MYASYELCMTTVIFIKEEEESGASRPLPLQGKYASHIDTYIIIYIYIRKPQNIN